MGKVKKAKRKLKTLCKKTAEEIVGVEVKIHLSDTFAAATPMEEEYSIPEIYLDVPGSEAIHNGDHTLIENRLYYKPANNYEYFTQAFYHEVGHLMTMRYFKFDAIQDYSQLFQKTSNKLDDYKILPHELVADIWSLFTYIPHHRSKVEEFERKSQKLLKIINRELDR